jgi:hypothetical protein
MAKERLIAKDGKCPVCHTKNVCMTDYDDFCYCYHCGSNWRSRVDDKGRLVVADGSLVTGEERRSRHGNNSSNS